MKAEETDEKENQHPAQEAGHFCCAQWNMPICPDCERCLCCCRCSPGEG